MKLAIFSKKTCMNFTHKQCIKIDYINNISEWLKHLKNSVDAECSKAASILLLHTA